MRDGFKVSGIHAGTVLTEVVKLQSVGYGADQRLVGESMRVMKFGFVCTEMPITIMGPGASPDPAIRIFANVRPELAFG